MINNGYVAKMLPSQQMCKSIDMKIGPNLRWSLIQCSGGDEGDRTPDLLTASQALSQLSYAPVLRSTIRELPSRCKDNFEQFCGAWNGCGAERTHDARSILSLQKQTGLLRRFPAFRPHAYFRKTGRQSTCGFTSGEFGVLSHPQSNVVNRHGFKMALNY